MLVDLPIFGQIDPGKPVVGIVAAGSELGWRRAALALQKGYQLVELGPTASPAIKGTALNVLPQHSPYLADLHNSIEITLLNEVMGRLARLPLGQAVASAICHLGLEPTFLIFLWVII